MEYLEALPAEGFNHDLKSRNEKLESQGIKAKFTKTGTTIAGIMFDGGVVLGADTRATGGSTVLDKMCKKLHFIAPNIYCAGAGTAADTQHVNRQVSHELTLLRLNTGRQSRVVTAVTKLSDKLFQYQGHIGAYLILAGFDCTGPWLYGISADGSFKHQPYTTLGSGSLAAMSVFETEFKDHFSVSEK
jgi:20S proteasome subunit beta 2